MKHKLLPVRSNLIILSISILILASCGESVKSPELTEHTVDYEIMVQRATQAAIWAMPAVGIMDLQKATIRDLGGTINDVVYLRKPFDSKHGFLTANDVTAYHWGSLSVELGPLVLEVPAASEKVFYFGTIVNAWDQPIEDVGPPGADKGKGGKYLLVPPGYQGSLPEEGYIIRHSDTYTLGFAFRPITQPGATYADAAAHVKGLKVYYLDEAENPPTTNYLDATDVPYNSLPTYDHTFFEDINDVIQQNPVREQDKAMISLLKDLGIEKGQPLNPTEVQKKAMKEGLELAYQSMQSYFLTEGKAMVPLWKGKSHWQVWNFAEGQPEAGFPYETENEILVDDRAGGSYFWITYLPKYLGGGTFYLTGIRDDEGDLLNGTDTYTLNVPADTPAKDFWSVIVYSMQTKGFVNGASRVGLSSRDADFMVPNEDGSYDIYFSAVAPEGFESNWIPTGEDFFLLFRLYGPESSDFYKSWVLGDIEKI